MALLYRLLNTQQDFFIRTYPYVAFMQLTSCLFCYTLEMDKQKAITLAGSQSELARILGIHRTAVHQWKKIPKGRIYQLMFLRPQWFVE
jgi:hypothetical protein